MSSSIDAVRRIGQDIAALHAEAVDREARFPTEAIEALRQERLLGAFVPAELGGLGCSFGELSSMCQALGQGCASAAMIFAMHNIQVGCIVRHAAGDPCLTRYLRELAGQQLLIASVTSEAGVGGSLRTSVAAVERDGDRCRLRKQATTVSYGLAADDLLVTCRRDPDAAAGDQVLVLLRRADRQLEQTGEWDTLGMRGTCSVGFKLAYEGTEERIVPGAYSDISAQTMLPFAHVLWSNLWLGIATDAVNRARAYIRNEARKTPGTQPPGAFRLAELVAELHAMRGFVHGATRDYQEIMDDPEQLAGMAFALRMNNLKISASQKMVEIIQRALMICGITGYRNDTKFSLGRHLRDALSAPLMVANDRIYGSNAAMLLVTKDD